MSSAGQTPAAPRPSVFISYSSDDRAAARMLRDTLTAAGLEVWYDENELGGGDAWDAKIRRQIRECDYFLPLISASTERRKEGYFRREWRLAAERTMDMADDVLFLLPVVIDDTSEASARVPDKFVSVQWLRAPGGIATPALEALIRRLLGGEHHAAPAPRPPLVSRPSNPPVSSPPPAPSAPPPPAGPPPMPPFPHHPANSGHWPKYFAEVLWWMVTAVWTIFVRLPKFFRILIGIWLVATVLGMCKSSSNNNDGGGNRSKSKSAKSSEVPVEAREALKAAKETLQAIAAAKKEGKEVDFEKLGEKMAEQFGVGVVKGQLAGKPLALVPFEEGQKDPVTAKFVDTVFSDCYGKLLVARPGASGISSILPPASTDEALVRVGQELKVEHVLGGRVTKAAADGPSVLEVRLLRSRDGVVVWSASYPVVADDAKAIGETVAAAVLATLPKK
jgi:TolB-like protein